MGYACSNRTCQGRPWCGLWKYRLWNYNIFASYQTHWLLLTLKGVYVVKAKACSLCCVLNGHKQHTYRHPGPLYRKRRQICILFPPSSVTHRGVKVLYILEFHSRKVNSKYRCLFFKTCLWRMLIEQKKRQICILISVKCYPLWCSRLKEGFCI